MTRCNWIRNYHIDGHPLFDLSNPIHRARLDEITAALDPLSLDDLDGSNETIESCPSIKSRTRDLPLITDNMGEEWKRFSIRAFPHGIISIFRGFARRRWLPSQIF
jgi:hypothetical protein